MKKVVLGMFIAAVMSQAAGCIFVSDDDDGDISDDVTDDGNAVIDVGWEWQQVDPTTGALSAATCPPGTSITVHTQEVDANGNPVGQEILDIYDCETSNSITPPLPPSTVSVYLSGTGGAGAFTSFTQFVDLTTENQVVDFDLIANGGFVQFAWDLVGGTTNAALACGDVSDLDGIGALVTLAGTTTAFDFQYSCEDGFGTTDPLAADDYVISIDAFNAANESLAEEPFNQNITVGAPNDILEIGTVQIPIAGL